MMFSRSQSIDVLDDNNMTIRECGFDGIESKSFFDHLRGVSQ